MILDKPLPQNWKSKRLKYVATYNDEALSETTDDEVAIDYVEISGVSLTGGIEEVNRMSFYQAPSRARRKVQPGDILVSTVRTYLKAIATVGPDASENLIASTGFCVVRPGEDTDPGYLGWVAKSEPFVGEVVARSVGVSYPAINASDLVDMGVPVPPMSVQQRIARFLDEKTACIDALIEKKQALLERLAEKRQALITRAVTKGMNPDVPMKPSGLEWLGEIPSHWNCKRLRFIGREPLKYGLNAPADIDNPDWPRFVRITDVGEDGALRSETFKSQPPEIANGYLLEEQDILLARSGATVGKSFMYRRSWGAACFAGYLIRVRVKREISAEFIYWVLNSAAYWTWVSAHFIQSTIQNINAERYANFWVALPPTRAEQDKIANHLESACSVIESEIVKVNQSMTRLSEYRSALITAAVTGQLPELTG